MMVLCFFTSTDTQNGNKRWKIKKKAFKKREEKRS
jgi:hypothetical protein